MLVAAHGKAFVNGLRVPVLYPVCWIAGLVSRQGSVLICTNPQLQSCNVISLVHYHLPPVLPRRWLLGMRVQPLLTLCIVLCQAIAHFPLGGQSWLLAWLSELHTNPSSIGGWLQCWSRALCLASPLLLIELWSAKTCYNWSNSQLFIQMCTLQVPEFKCSRKNSKRKFLKKTTPQNTPNHKRSIISGMSDPSQMNEWITAFQVIIVRKHVYRVCLQTDLMTWTL